MGLTSLLGPAVIAAVVSGAVTIVGYIVSNRTARRLHIDRLAADREFAERKIAADIALTERKFQYDRDFDAWKRRTALAEEVLAEFYKAKDIIEAVRSPGSLGGEGETRPRESWETDADVRLLDSYYWPVERLNKHSDFFAEFLAKRYRFVALFGDDAGQPFLDFWRIRGEILVAVRMLISTHQQRQMGSLPDDRKQWETTMGWVHTQVDPVAVRLAGIIEAIEKICRPAIQEVVT